MEHGIRIRQAFLLLCAKQHAYDLNKSDDKVQIGTNCTRMANNIEGEYNSLKPYISAMRSFKQECKLRRALS